MPQRRQGWTSKVTYGALWNAFTSEDVTCYFETVPAERYPVATTVERNLWLSRDYLQPDYAGRPWTLWTANASYRNEAGETPVRWVVLQP